MLDVVVQVEGRIQRTRGVFSLLHIERGLYIYI